MPRIDWFNEALITAMLAACAKTDDGGARDAPEADPADTEDLTRARNLKARLLSLLDEAHRLAVANGLPPEYADTADFAVCAFIDETLLSSGWSGRTEWMARPLQLERHATGTAGEDFYRILDGLLEKTEHIALPGLSSAAGTLPAPAPVQSGPKGYAPDAASPPDEPESFTAGKALENTLEIFALCLAQGFTGMYFHDADAVRSYLRKIGRLVPSVGAGRDPEGEALFAPVPGAAPRASSSLLLRFDVLDWLLWLAPIGITAVLHHICGSRLDGMLAELLQRSSLP
jgi:type VI protein secretion system component VasF